MKNKLLAEFIGTFWLVFGGCGAALFAAGYPKLGIGFVGVSIAFGLTVITMAYSIGHISGAHLNPAVTIGLWIGGRFPKKEVIPYIIVQVLGSLLASFFLYIIAKGHPGFNLSHGFTTNGYGLRSPGHYNLLSCLITELILSGMFIFVILGVTHKLSVPSVSGLIIGGVLTLINLVCIPITNCSVNPARSTGPALFVGDAALHQLWLFWLAPILGAIIGAYIYKNLCPETEIVELSPDRKINLLEGNY
jgi:aquaporin Z